MATTGGSSYFTDQQRLLEVVLATRALAHEIGVDVSVFLTDERMDATLRRTRALMVLGAVNAGKSTLLNALIRTPLCPVSPLPTTKRIAVYQKPGADAARFAHPLAETCHREGPAVLEEFTVIDTPGANGFTPEIHDALCSLASESDFILVVLAVTNPWEPATWDALAKLPDSLYHKLVFVLQQADLRPRQDIGVLVGHVADLARKRCGITPPVFPVAASNPPADETAYLTSGCAELWQHLIDGIRNGDAYRKNIADWKSRVADALRLMDDQIDSTHREIGYKSRMLDDVEEEVGRMHASFRRQLESKIEELASSFRAGNADTLRLLRKRLRFPSSVLRLFSRDDTAFAMEADFVARLKSMFQHIGKEDAMAILASCRDHARTVEKKMSEQGLALPMTDAELEKTLEQAGNGFCARLDQAAAVRLESVRVRNRLTKELRRRNRALAAFVGTCLLVLTLGSVAGALGATWPAYVLCGIAALFLLGGYLAAWRTKPRVLEGFDRQMGDACVAFAKALLTDYEDALRAVFRDYAATMLPLRSMLSRREATVKPMQKRWQEVFLRLKALE